MSHEHEHENCDCGCEELEEDVVMLEDEDGNQVAFHYITTLENNGKEYVCLQAAEDDEACLEIYELESVEEDGEEYDNLLPVDDETYELLYNQLMAEISDCGDECDDEDCDCHHHHE